MKEYPLKLEIGLSSDHLTRLGLSTGECKPSARDADISNICNYAVNDCPLSAMDEFKSYTAGFFLGYIMRGYDYLLDFDLEDEEILSTVIKSYINLPWVDTMEALGSLLDDIERMIGLGILTGHIDLDKTLNELLKEVSEDE